MLTALIPAPTVAGPQLRTHLDALATWVAERLDAGDLEAAWAATRELEALVSAHGQPETRPPAPVVGRRFAAAHASLLSLASAATSAAGGRAAA